VFGVAVVAQFFDDVVEGGVWCFGVCDVVLYGGVVDVEMFCGGVFEVVVFGDCEGD